MTNENQHPLSDDGETPEIIKRLINFYNECGNFETIRDVVNGFKQEPEMSFGILEAFLVTEFSKTEALLKENANLKENLIYLNVFFKLFERNPSEYTFLVNIKRN